MLRAVGVKTVGCCCGHGKGSGSILIEPQSEFLVRYLGYETSRPSAKPAAESGLLEIKPAPVGSISSRRWAVASCASAILRAPMGIHSIQRAVTRAESVVPDK